MKKICLALLILLIPSITLAEQYNGQNYSYQYQEYYPQQYQYQSEEYYPQQNKKTVRSKAQDVYEITNDVSYSLHTIKNLIDTFKSGF